jgi:hypothetical protein
VGFSSLKKLGLVLGAMALLTWGLAVGEATPPTRLEARSPDLLAVALIHENRMTIHLSRLMDNAPVRDAAVSVLLRGVSYPTIAEADGSFSLESKELALPGAAAVEFQISQATGPETLKATYQVAETPVHSEDKNGARQLWWWVLNFAVCIGFLMLISRRRKNAQD